MRVGVAPPAPPGFDCARATRTAGKIRGVTIDTSHFKGNYPAQCSLEAVNLAGQPAIEELTNESLKWTEILPLAQLQGDSQNHFAIDSDDSFTHLRFKIFPDGGVARLRVYGEVTPDWERLKRLGGPVDLAAAEHGGRVLSCSDMFFGHRHNLIMPGRATNMSDGWETATPRFPVMIVDHQLARRVKSVIWKLIPLTSRNFPRVCFPRSD